VLEFGFSAAGSKLKILHVGKYFAPFSGGLENYMRDAMVALADRGIASLALVHRHSLSLRGTDETYTASGHAFRIVRTGLWARFLFTPISPAFPWQLRRLVKTAQPDILHLHLPNTSAFWALLLPSARRIPWVVHWHADVITSARGWLMGLFYGLYRPFETALLKRARLVVATSPPYLESSRPLQKWRAKCRVVPLGVDTGRYAKATAQSMPAPGSDTPGAGPLHVLAVGRLTYYKGFRYLVEAAAKVADCRVSLVGRGDEAAQLEALAASLGLEERVTFHGVLSDADLAQLMRDCDCLCLPSVERTEAFGMVLLEAMYFGKATIVGDVEGSGMGWVVDGGVTGLKAEPADADALAGAIARFAACREEMLEMGKRGKEKFDRQFEINHAVAPLAEVYREALAPPGQQ